MRGSVTGAGIFMSVLLCVWCKAASADSTNRYALKYKGVDISLGPDIYAFGSSVYVWLAPDFLPMETRSRSSYENATADGYSLLVAKPSLQVVFGTDKVHYRNPILHKYEYCFGFTYGVASDYVKIKNISRHNDVVTYPVNLEASYTYREQLFHAGIKASSKAIKGVLAFYTGANLMFGVTNFRSREQNKFDDKYIEPERFGKTTSGVQLNAGVKYNLSCDINIFGQYEYGCIYFSRAPYAIGFQGISLGIRYKFIDEQDRKNYQDSGFW